MLGDWLSHMGRHSEHASGILFRQTYDELEGIIERANEIYPAAGGIYNETKKIWKFPSFPGTPQLKLRFLEREKDADRYQGHAYTWGALDELGNYSTPYAVDKIRATLRSAHGVPVKMLCSANPGGAGHDWVKARYISPIKPFIPQKEKDGFTKIFIPAKLEDNPILMKNDPGYEHRIMAAIPEYLKQAWRYGDWDIMPDLEEALWSRGIIDDFRVGAVPAGVEIIRIVVAVDPAVTGRTTSDETGLVVVGKGSDGHFYILEDASGRYSPSAWAAKAVMLYERWEADRIIGEVNNGGDLIEIALRQHGGNISYKSVRASRGKIARAEPIASLYERGMVHHVGDHPKLENQMCRLDPANGKADGRSPDRVDAMVWGVSFLMGAKKIRFTAI